MHLPLSGSGFRVERVGGPRPTKPPSEPIPKFKMHGSPLFFFTSGRGNLESRGYRPMQPRTGTVQFLCWSDKLPIRHNWFSGGWRSRPKAWRRDRSKDPGQDRALGPGRGRLGLNPDQG